MKHTTRAIALMAAAAAAPGAAFADDKPTFEVGGFAGAHLFNDDNELGVQDNPGSDSPDSSIAFGIRLGYWFHRYLMVEGELLAAPTEMRESSTPVTVFGWRANALVPFTQTRVQPFALLGAGFLTSSPRDQDDVTTDTDALAHLGLGVRARVQRNWGVRGDLRLLFPPSSAGGSATTDWEVLVGLYKTFGHDTDSDGDGVADEADSCPADAEDRDGFEDSDGCPDSDNDGDGIPDARDQCREQAETQNGLDDEDGCPEGDPDNDGIAGRADQCPSEPEDADGNRDDDGCPEKDPPADGDGDGIADELDRCAGEPETRNGYQDDDGCPDTVPDQVARFTGTIQGIRFELGSDRITGASRPVLDEAARVLAAYPTVKLEIQGHTDSTGSRQLNLDLSQRRAAAVERYLVNAGIARARLTARGYGPDRPIADNNTTAGQAKNRRVEFVLVSQ